MTEDKDFDLIGYCEIHCQTERALFSGEHVNQMIALAGHPSSFPRQVDPSVFYSLHEEMEELCRLARIEVKRRQNKIAVQMATTHGNVVSMSEFAMIRNSM